jgi:hypothetical protein
MFTLIEFCLAAMSIAVAYAFPKSCGTWFAKCEGSIRRLAAKPALAVLTVGLVALAGRVILLPLLPVPQPQVTDEFGYLLAGDTFSHGRLTNPSHPMWTHFESIAIIHKPTYCSVFYPAQGIFLAVGEVIGGHPFLGVWLSVGLVCASICWMLQAWLPPAWALVGGLLAVIRLGTFSYWANSYWGGGVAAIGGALVLGALPRVKRHLRTRDALLMGLGLAILANSRPYEGLFFSVPVGMALWVWILGKKAPPPRLSMRRIIIPLGLVLVVTAGAMGYYFWRTTGSPFRTPYLVNQETYFVTPLFPWVPLKPAPSYHDQALEEHYTIWEVHQYEFARAHPIQLILKKAFQQWLFFLGPILTLPLLSWIVISPRKFFAESVHGKTGFLWLICAVSLLGSLLPTVFSPHYAAAVTCAIYALVVESMRHVRVWQWQREWTGMALMRFVPVICVVMLVLRAAAPQLHIPLPIAWHYSWCSPHLENLDRARVLAQLLHSPGRHLAIVRYKSDHDRDWEWVYNEADIDSAKVVWARDMGPSKNQELVDYFRDRHVWLMEPDKNPPGLTPYPSVDLSHAHN